MKVPCWQMDLGYLSFEIRRQIIYLMVWQWSDAITWMTRWWKFRQNSPISHQTVRFSTNLKTFQISVFTCSNAIIWQDFHLQTLAFMKIWSGFFDEILTIVDDQLSISRRLIESEFLKRNRAEERFTMMGMFTSPAHFTIWDRLGAIFKQDVS